MEKMKIYRQKRQKRQKHQKHRRHRMADCRSSMSAGLLDIKLRFLEFLSYLYPNYFAFENNRASKLAHSIKDFFNPL
jgi:hypothetical protein